MQPISVRTLVQILKDHGCVLIRQGKGSHAIWGVPGCGKCRTTVAGALGDSVPRGTLSKIQRDLSHCLGETWLRDATQ